MICIKYRLFTMFFIISLLSFTSSGQNVTNSEVNFPKDWVGNWSGKLEIIDVKGLKQSLNMELHIQPIDGFDHYEWSIIYGDDREKGLKGYELHAKNPQKGIWAIDEKNGIILDCYLLGNKLFSSYNVLERNFLVTYEKRENELLFEISFGPESPIAVTGSGKIGEEDIPEVKAYEISGMQRAILTKN